MMCPPLIMPRLTSSVAPRCIKHKHSWRYVSGELVSPYMQHAVGRPMVQWFNGSMRGHGRLLTCTHSISAMIVRLMNRRVSRCLRLERLE